MIIIKMNCPFSLNYLHHELKRFKPTREPNFSREGRSRGSITLRPSENLKPPEVFLAIPSASIKFGTIMLQPASWPAKHAGQLSE